MHPGARDVHLTHTDKIFFPDDGLTKGDLIRYYARIADRMLPFLRDRLVVMHRFPDGLAGEGFYHKERPDYFPDWIEGETVRNQDGTDTTYVICQEPAALVYLANQACITLHLWLSRRDALDRPDRLIFDLDPPGDDFGAVKRLALEMRALLADLGLVSFAMTTGSRGLHVVVPLDRGQGFDEVRGFARQVAGVLVARHSDEVTIEARKAKRGSRILVDVMRNSFAQTGVAPYSVRARRGAPIATPVGWDEVRRSSLGPQSTHMGNIFRRLGRKQDVWAGMTEQAQSLAEAQRRLAEL